VQAEPKKASPAIDVDAGDSSTGSGFINKRLLIIQMIPG
jgi:hypothetical protein